MSDADDPGLPDALSAPDATPDPAGPGRRLAGVGVPGLDRASAGPGVLPHQPARTEPGTGDVPAVAPGALRLRELPLLMIVGPAVDALPADTLPVGEGHGHQRVEHEVAGTARRAERVAGVALPLSETGLDRAAGLVALGADHSRGCLGAGGLSLGDATRYAARLERLGLLAETCWRGLAEGYYVLDAEPWNLRRLVHEHAVTGAEDLVGRLADHQPGGPAPRASLVLLGPTCTTAA